MVQMELIVVNNWHVITEMFVERTSVWARFYFVSVYFAAVVVVMNVLTAFVLEAFISQYERNENEIKRILKLNEMATDEDSSPYAAVVPETPTKKRNEIEERMHSVIGLFKPQNEVSIYRYSRKLSKALFYEQLYPELFRKKTENEMDIEIPSNHKRRTSRIALEPWKSKMGDIAEETDETPEPRRAVGQTAGQTEAGKQEYKRHAVQFTNSGDFMNGMNATDIVMPSYTTPNAIWLENCESFPVTTEMGVTPHNATVLK